MKVLKEKITSCDDAQITLVPIKQNKNADKTHVLVLDTFEGSELIKKVIIPTNIFEVEYKILQKEYFA